MEGPGSSRRSFFSRRFSNSSILSLASVNTVLPRYSVLDNSESGQDHPPGFDDLSSPLPTTLTDDHLEDALPTPSLPNTPVLDSPVFPATAPENGMPYTYIRPTYSVILSSPPSPPVAQGQEFEYKYPIRPNKPWATLHLHTHESIPGILRPSSSQPKTPRVWSCEPVQGKVELDLENQQSIQQINISLKGKIITSSFEGGSYPFVSQEFILWSKAFGDPRRTTADSSKDTFDGKFVGKYFLPFSFSFPTYVDLSEKAATLRDGTISSSPTVLGQSNSPSPPPFTPPPTSPGSERQKPKRSSWSSFLASSWSSSDSGTSTDKQKRRKSVLPQQLIRGESSMSSNAQVSYKPGGSDDIIVCPMPQSFADRRFSARVIYELSVVIVHGRFRPDSKIKTGVAYIPAIQPLPMSQKRREAYEAGGVLPSPVADPSGWFALPKVTIEGELDSGPTQRRTHVDCTLYLANPLSYTMGTVIPCYLTISSDDSEALDFLCSPKIPVVRLNRRIKHFTPYGGTSSFEEQSALGLKGTIGDSIPSPMLTPATSGRSGAGGDLKTVLHELGTAVWWNPPKDVVQGAYVRHLEGEIHLNPSLTPSCACTIFSVEYFVEMLPLKSPYFESSLPPSPKLETGKARAQTVVIASQVVEITTLYRSEEPVPVAFSEPPRTRRKSIPTDTIEEQAEEAD